MNVRYNAVFCVLSMVVSVSMHAFDWRDFYAQEKKTICAAIWALRKKKILLPLLCWDHIIAAMIDEKPLRTVIYRGDIYQKIMAMQEEKKILKLSENDDFIINRYNNQFFVLSRSNKKDNLFSCTEWYLGIEKVYKQKPVASDIAGIAAVSITGNYVIVFNDQARGTPAYTLLSKDQNGEWGQISIAEKNLNYLCKYYMASKSFYFAKDDHYLVCYGGKDKKVRRHKNKTQYVGYIFHKKEKKRQEGNGAFVCIKKIAHIKAILTNPAMSYICFRLAKRHCPRILLSDYNHQRLDFDMQDTNIDCLYKNDADQYVIKKNNELFLYKKYGDRFVHKVFPFEIAKGTFISRDDQYVILNKQGTTYLYKHDVNGWQEQQFDYGGRIYFDFDRSLIICSENNEKIIVYNIEHQQELSPLPDKSLLKGRPRDMRPFLLYRSDHGVGPLYQRNINAYPVLRLLTHEQINALIKIQDILDNNHDVTLLDQLKSTLPKKLRDALS